LRLDELLYRSQTAFVKGCFIQDGFKLVQAAAKVLHIRRKDSILLKVDIAWAFDSMSWPSLGDPLAHGVPATLDGLGVGASRVSKYKGAAEWVPRCQNL
jgi:hypothetical protein